MADYCVVVADGSRARFFTLEPVPIPEVESGPNLVEQRDLVDPERALHGRDQFSETKSGRNMAPRGGPAHGYDDHRERHEDEMDHRFAHRIADIAIDVARQNGAKYLVLAASSRMLGFLREVIKNPAGIEVREAPKDLTYQSPIEIHRHLSEEKLLPPRETRVPAQQKHFSEPGSGANWSG
jgi:protein required for attachment to host cells